MKTILTLLSLLTIISLGSFSSADDRLINYPGFARPIAFNGQTYRLSLSAQPTDGYIRQEYLPATEAAEAYHDLFMLSVVTTGLTVDEAVAMQVRKLEQIQQDDLTVNYKIRKDAKNGTAILDFVWRAYSDDVKPMIEWNAYRFSPYEAPSGKKGVLMIGNRRRAYGSDILPFLNAFRHERPRVLDSLSVYKMPATQLAN